jgi:hypothetical protein
LPGVVRLVKALIASSTLRWFGGILVAILVPGWITHNAAGRFRGGSV